MAMKPTSIPWLFGVAAIAALLGWGFAAWVDGNGRLPAVPWLAVVMIWVVAGFVGAWAVVARRRLHPKPGAARMAPLMAARTTALGSGWVAHWRCGLRDVRRGRRAAAG